MDLTTRYMGLELKNPLVAAASPLSSTVNSIRRLEDAGASAVVLYSLFEEQLLQEQELDEMMSLSRDNTFAESLSFLPGGGSFHAGPVRYLEMIQKARSVVDIPVIASLNGCTTGGWVDYARQIEEAGAHGLELHVYYNPPSLDISGRDVEALYLEIARRVKKAVKIPVALKVDPYFSAFGNMARQFDETGVDALVMFNRMLQPNFNLQTLEVEPSWPVSHPGEIGVPLRWIAVLHGKLKTSLAATTGAHDHEDIVKYLLAGADVVMLASALIKNGAGYLTTLLNGLESWMERRGFESIREMQGVMSQQSVSNPEVFERMNYIRMLDGCRR